MQNSCGIRLWWTKSAGYYRREGGVWEKFGQEVVYWHARILKYRFSEQFCLDRFDMNDSGVGENELPTQSSVCKYPSAHLSCLNMS